MYVYVKLVISTVLYMVVGLHDVSSRALGLGALLGVLLAFYYPQNLVWISGWLV